MGGKLKQGIPVIDENNNEIARIKNIQQEGKNLREASSGEEVAISLPGTTFDRQLKSCKSIYSDLTEQQFRNFKKNKDLLSESEKKILQEIALIKRKFKPTWGV